MQRLAHRGQSVAETMSLRGSVHMLLLMTDAFADAVNDARRRLEDLEGHKISINEIARRAGIPTANLHHHLTPNRTAKTRRVPTDLVNKLASVLPISEADLSRAAQIASGHTVQETGVDLPDLRGTLIRYLHEAPDKASQMRTVLEVQRIMNEEMQRILAENNER
jgi:hypothetical protein